MFSPSSNFTRNLHSVFHLLTNRKWIVKYGGGVWIIVYAKLHAGEAMFHMMGKLKMSFMLYERAIGK